MSIFRKHESSADRSSADRSRHKQKIEKAIKESIKDVVAEESIIGQDGKKKIKIPVKGIKEYRFVYGSGEQNKQAGSAGDKEVGQGDQVGRKQGQGTQGGQGDKPGNKPGEETYEVEISLAELAEYLFSDLELPDLERKRFRFITQEKPKRKGHRLKGIRSKLSKKETLKRRIKRKKAAISSGAYNPEEDDRFPFHNSDRKYTHSKPKPKENTAAVIFFLMDVSGSMGSEKKYLARSFFFLLYQFLNHQYENIEVVFIAHTTNSKEVNEHDFFRRSNSGGTLMSTSLELADEIVKKRYHPNSWNIYTFYCGDGENWPEDNEKTLSLYKEMLEYNQLMCYTEIIPGNPPNINSVSFFGGDPFYGLWNELAPLSNHKNFKKLRIMSDATIWSAFKKLFGGKE
jgi:uncharacterized protein